MRLRNLCISTRVKICPTASPPFLPQSPQYTHALQRNIKFKGVKIWNSVPTEKKTFNRFKKQYKKHLLSNYT